MYIAYSIVLRLQIVVKMSTVSSAIRSLSSFLPMLCRTTRENASFASESQYLVPTTGKDSLPLAAESRSLESHSQEDFSYFHQANYSLFLQVQLLQQLLFSGAAVNTLILLQIHLEVAQ